MNPKRRAVGIVSLLYISFVTIQWRAFRFESGLPRESELCMFAWVQSLDTGPTIIAIFQPSPYMRTQTRNPKLANQV